MESRGIDYLASVRQAFLTQLPYASQQTRVIDASQAPDQVHQAIRAAISDCIA
jgi:dTMP kinase